MATENLKKVFAVIAGGASQAEKSFADGFQVKDIFDFMPQILQIPNISFKEIAAEVASRTDETNKEVVQYVKDQLELENAWLENLVEKGFEAIVSVDSFARSLKKPEVAATV